MARRGSTAAPAASSVFVSVRVVQCRDLIVQDVLGGSSDPYAEVRVGAPFPVQWLTLRPPARRMASEDSVSASAGADAGGGAAAAASAEASAGGVTAPHSADHSAASLSHGGGAVPWTNDAAPAETFSFPVALTEQAQRSRTIAKSRVPVWNQTMTFILPAGVTADGRHCVVPRELMHVRLAVRDKDIVVDDNLGEVEFDAASVLRLTVAQSTRGNWRSTTDETQAGVPDTVLVARSTAVSRELWLNMRGVPRGTVHIVVHVRCAGTPALVADKADVGELLSIGAGRVPSGLDPVGEAPPRDASESGADAAVAAVRDIDAAQTWLRRHVVRDGVVGAADDPSGASAGAGAGTGAGDGSADGNATGDSAGDDGADTADEDASQLAQRMVDPEYGEVVLEGGQTPQRTAAIVDAELERQCLNARQTTRWQAWWMQSKIVAALLRGDARRKAAPALTAATSAESGADGSGLLDEGLFSPTRFGHHLSVDMIALCRGSIPAVAHLPPFLTVRMRCTGVATVDGIAYYRVETTVGNSDKTGRGDGSGGDGGNEGSRVMAVAWRRFSEFDSLQQALKRVAPDIRTGAFPTKSLFRRTSRDYLVARRLALDAWLHSVFARHPELFVEPLLCDFGLAPFPLPMSVRGATVLRARMWRVLAGADFLRHEHVLAAKSTDGGASVAGSSRTVSGASQVGHLRVHGGVDWGRASSLGFVDDVTAWQEAGGTAARFATCQEAFEAIDKDIERSNATPDEYPALRRVLRAFALWVPSIGYCQGANFVVVAFLRALETEVDAFWMLAAASRHVVPHLYGDALYGVQTIVEVLREGVKLLLPEVWRALEELYVPVELFAVQWVVNLFTGNVVPFRSCLRLWDCFVCQGEDMVFCAVIALLDLHKAEITGAGNSSECMDAIKRAARDCFDVGTVVERAGELLGSLDKRWLSRVRGEAKAKVTANTKRRQAVKLADALDVGTITAEKLRGKFEGLATTMTGTGVTKSIDSVAALQALCEGLVPRVAEDSAFAEAVFAALDTDESGTLELEEFTVGLAAMSNGSPEERVAVMFRCFDSDGSGTISLEEWRAIMAAAHKVLLPGSSSRAVDEVSNEMFKSCDEDGDGELSLAEFQTLMQLQPAIMAALTATTTAASTDE